MGVKQEIFKNLVNFLYKTQSVPVDFLRFGSRLQGHYNHAVRFSPHVWYKEEDY